MNIDQLMLLLLFNNKNKETEKYVIERFINFQGFT